MSEIDWAELVKDADLAPQNFQPIPPGDYDFKVIGVEEKTTSSNKTMFKVKAEIQTGSYAKRLVWDNITISPENPNAMGFFFRKMGALGLTKEFFASRPSNAAIIAGMSGRPFKGRVEIESYNGQPQNKLKAYSAASQSAVSPGYPAPQGAAPVAPPAPPQGYAPSQPPAAPPAVAAPQYAPQAPAQGYPATPPAPPAAPQQYSEDPWQSTPAAPPAPPAAAPQGFTPPPDLPF